MTGSKGQIYNFILAHNPNSELPDDQEDSIIDSDFNSSGPVNADDGNSISDDSDSDEMIISKIR